MSKKNCDLVLPALENEFKKSLTADEDKLAVSVAIQLISCLCQLTMHSVLFLQSRKHSVL